jgi:hypothetical protein
MSIDLSRALAQMRHRIALIIGTSTGLATGITVAFLIWNLV